MNVTHDPHSKIDTIRIPGVEGQLGITSCPGMRDEFLFDLYSETLFDDLQTLRAWGAAVVITLLEESELNVLGVRELGKQVVALNMIWLHLPIRNAHLPDQRFFTKWEIIAPSLCSLLQQGQNVVVHCKEGLGRAGLVAVTIMAELGVSVAEAVRIVRKARPGSLNLSLHEQYCHTLAERQRGFAAEADSVGRRVTA